jgi:hypothetical protein
MPSWGSKYAARAALPLSYNPEFLPRIKQLGSSGGSLDIYSAGHRFEFRQGHLLFCLRFIVVYLAISRQNID